MDWNAIFDLIDQALLMNVAACWAVGVMLKKTPKVPDWTIIYIVTVVAVLLAIGTIGFSTEAVVQGILCGAVAVYGHQIVKQTINRD